MDPVLEGRRLDRNDILVGREKGGKEGSIRPSPFVEEVVGVNLDELEVLVDERVGGLEV